MQTISSCIISIGKEIGVGMHSGMMCIEMLKIETLKTLRIHRLSTCVVITFATSQLTQNMHSELRLMNNHFTSNT